MTDAPDDTTGDRPGRSGDEESNDEPASDRSGHDDGDAAGDRRPGWWRPRTGVTAAILVGILGFTMAVQIRSHEDDTLSSARTEDLVRILADLDSQRARLRDEIADLSQDKDELTSGNAGHQAALDRAEELADSVGILAGTLPATGPGLTLTFTPGDAPIRAAVMLDAVEELRGAGAEAIQLDGSGGTSVRIVASSYFAERGDELLIDDVGLAADFVLTVIGDPDTMATAMNIPGGVADTVKKDGGTVMVRQPDSVDVTTLATQKTPQYAEPVD